MNRQIYTIAEISDDLQNSGNGVVFYKSVPQNKVLYLQQSDILLFAEDIVGAEWKVERLSFSAKILDYLNSGKCIYAIGDNDIVPMEYFGEGAVDVCVMI